MKKIFIITLAIISSALISCQKESIGGTAVEDASGQWYVKRYLVFTDGSVVDGFGEFGYQLKPYLLLTYNTSDNKADELFVDDLGEFYYAGWGMRLDFKVKTKVDLKTLKFSAIGAENLYEDALVNIEGQILKGVAKTAGGAPRDSIWMKVTHEGDTFVEEGFELEGFDHYLITGVRYTGFEADE